MDIGGIDLPDSVKEYIKYIQNPDANADMHNHTTASDGDDSPLYALYRAYRKGLTDFSITDHNSVNGYRILCQQLEKVITHFEDIDNDNTLSEPEKKKMRTVAGMVLRMVERVNIVTGCEVVTVFKGCPYVEILAYGVDIDVLEEKLNDANSSLNSASEKISNGLKKCIKDNNLVIDTFYIDNRNDYKRLFFHELISHPENAFLFDQIEGSTESEKAENFAKKYLENPESNFYVDLDNSKTRKIEIQKMVKQHPELTFDVNVLKNVGSVAGQFYSELLKHPENLPFVNGKFNSLKEFIYLGLYNESSPFFVDLSTTKPSPEAVINAIHESGGKALVAHWGRYRKSNREVFDWEMPQGKKNLEEILDMCDGAECAYPDNPMPLRRLIYSLCKEKGKMISIGGDSHGKSGKEGKQYQLASQTGKLVEELKWIKASTISGKDFISQLEEEHRFRQRLRNLVEEKKSQVRHPDKDIEKSVSEQGD